MGGGNFEGGPGKFFSQNKFGLLYKCLLCKISRFRRRQLYPLGLSAPRTAAPGASRTPGGAGSSRPPGHQGRARRRGVRGLRRPGRERRPEQPAGRAGSPGSCRKETPFSPPLSRRAAANTGEASEAKHTQTVQAPNVNSNSNGDHPWILPI